MPIINTVQGNLITRALRGKYSAIAHGCSCLNTFGAGIAPQIGEAFPDALRADQATIRGDRTKMGTFTLGLEKLGNGYPLLVFNCYTQFSTSNNKRMVDYPALGTAFKRISQCYGDKLIYGDLPLGIPMIGAGLAGGNWDTIVGIINEVTPDVQIELVEYQS